MFFELISTTWLYFSRFDTVRSESDLWNKMSLYDLKFILEGDKSENIKSRKYILKTDFCFEIVTENREFIFELPKFEKLQIIVKTEMDQLEKYKIKKDGVAKRKSEKEKKDTSSNSSNQVDDPRITYLKNANKGGESIRFVDDKEKYIEFIELFKSLIKEVRSSQIFVDRSGIPIKRVKPQSSLKKIHNK